MTVALVVLALLVANAFFVAAEFALVGTPRASLEHAAARGSDAAARVLALLEDPDRQDRFIATSQIGISLASIGLGMYGEHQMAMAVEARVHGWQYAWLTAHGLASLVALTVLTYLHIVIGEIVPKALALQQPAGMILAIVPVMRTVETALGPLVRLLTGMGHSVLRAAGISREGERSDRHHSAEELQFVIEESERGGLLEGESGQVLRDLFTFGDLTVAHVMVPLASVTGLDAGEDAGALRALVTARPHTRYLVYDGGRIAGSVHIKTLLRLMRAGRGVGVRDARPLPSLPATATLEAVLGAMRAHRAQLAIATGDDGQPVGLVTMEDLCEEVLGTIDETR
ncbi:MAG: hemolysin family protein [Vicinamibacterales bacterium]